MPPAEPRKPAVVSIGGDPLAARLDGQRGEKRVRDEVASSARPRTKIGEDLPMPLGRGDRNRVGLFAQKIAKLDRTCQRRGRMEMRGWVTTRRNPPSTRSAHYSIQYSSRRIPAGG